MDPITLALLAVLCTIFGYVIYQAWKVNQKWKEKGVPHVKPWLFLGNSGSLLLMKKSIGELHLEILNKFPNEPVVGYYDFMKPTLLIRDADWIEKILIKDFVHFTDHGFPVDEKRNPFDSNLFTMTGKRWKACRNKLSPIFTTGKLRNMFQAMSDCSEQLIGHIEKVEELELREILGRYAMDVIGSCAFGIDAGNLAKEDNEFRRMGKKAFEMDAAQFVKFIIATNFPSLMRFLGITFNKADVVKYFTAIINDTVKYRRENDVKRNDFVQLMMQLQDKGYVEIHTKDPDDDYLNLNETSYSTEKFELSNEQLTGQAFTFLTAGFEATALAMTYTLFEMSKNLEIQKRVREEIKREVKAAGSLTYDSIKGMEYLEQCLKETMRKYPPTQMMFRACTKEYELPNGMKIEPKQAIIIPLTTLHQDARYYPEPQAYKPERFDPANEITPCAFLAFGNGPRMCIAMRFAMTEMKNCLAKLLMNFEFTLNPKTKEPLTINARNFFTSPNETLIFNVKKVSTA